MLEAGTVRVVCKIAKEALSGPNGKNGGMVPEEAMTEVPVPVWVVVESFGGARGVGAMVA